MPNSVRITAVPLELKVLCALHFFGQGSFQKGVGCDNNLGLSQSAVSVCIEEVVTALNNPVIFTRAVCFPATEEERRAIIQRHFQIAPNPGVLGLVDGTHVAIVSPVEHEEQYVNRKGYHSLNVQIVTTSDYKILNVVARYPGATHDSFIWTKSAVRRRMEEMYRGGEQCWLLGGSGYPQEPWIQVPILDAPDGSAEARFTTTHMMLRSGVERAIGHWKMRFKCLHRYRTLEYCPVKAGRIVNACAVLHNKCVAANLPPPADVIE